MPIFGLIYRRLGETFDLGAFTSNDVLVMLLLGGAFVFFMAWSARAAAGRVVVQVDREHLTVFTGVGRIGSSKTIPLKDIANIEEGTARSRPKKPVDVRSNGIVISGDRPFAFAELLNEERMKFVLNGLRRVVLRKRFSES